MNAELLNNLAEEAGIDLGKRPQDLSIDDFKRFSGLYQSLPGNETAP